MNFSKLSTRWCQRTLKRRISPIRNLNFTCRYILLCISNTQIQICKIIRICKAKKSTKNSPWPNPSSKDTWIRRAPNYQKLMSFWHITLYHIFPIRRTTLVSSICLLLIGFKISNRNLKVSYNQIVKNWDSRKPARIRNYTICSRSFRTLLVLMIRGNLVRMSHCRIDWSSCRRTWWYSRRRRHIRKGCCMSPSSSGPIFRMMWYEIAKNW